jgi:hypothetical protein
MAKAKYLRLKDLKALIAKYPDAILTYPVNEEEHGYNHKLATSKRNRQITVHEAYVGKGPKTRQVIVIK